jgi:hypothetical protein
MMKKIIPFLKAFGVILLSLGFFIPWYRWDAELVRDRVAVNMFGGGGTWISGWQLILPQTLIHDVPASKSQYMVLQGVSPADVLQGVGMSWAVVPALVLLLIIAAVVLMFVRRLQNLDKLRNGFGPMVVGGCILLMVYLWNPVSPAPLDKLDLTPFLGKFVTIFGAFLLGLSGFIFFLMKPAIEQAVIPQVASDSPALQFRTCLKCHESVPGNLEVCPNCRNQMI